jgi:hypothetical protein
MSIEMGYHQHPDGIPDHYCEHGNYIGSPYGADILCGWCEDGISVAEMHRIQRANRKRRIVREMSELRQFYEIAIGSLEAVPYNAKTATGLTRWVWERTDQLKPPRRSQ